MTTENLPLIKDIEQLDQVIFITYENPVPDKSIKCISRFDCKLNDASSVIAETMANDEGFRKIIKLACLKYSMI